MVFSNLLPDAKQRATQPEMGAFSPVLRFKKSEYDLTV
jgi:hypothetical protein